MEGAAGVRVSPGLTHWNIGLPLTVPGRVTKQVRETDPPAMGEEVEGEREIISGSAGRQHMSLPQPHSHRHYTCSVAGTHSVVQCT